MLLPEWVPFDCESLGDVHHSSMLKAPSIFRLDSYCSSFRLGVGGEGRGLDIEDYLGNLLLPVAVQRLGETHAEHGVALDDGIDGPLNGINGDMMGGNSQSDALVETSVAIMFDSRPQIQALNWR